MNWHKVSDYCIRNGLYTVAKVVVNGKPWFEIWYRKQYMGRYETPQEAKRMCENDSARVLTKAA